MESPFASNPLKDKCLEFIFVLSYSHQIGGFPFCLKDEYSFVLQYSHFNPFSSNSILYKKRKGQRLDSFWLEN